MEELRLDFHGVGGAVACDDPLVSENLRRDFAFFLAKSCDPSFRVTLRLDAVPRELVPRRRASLCGAHYVAYDNGPVRAVDYHGRALAIMDFRSESAEVFSEDGALLHELGYLLICSRAGFLLDRRGLHRVHALGVAREGKGALVLLPSGGGKTALGLDLLRSGQVQLLSEDTPLLGPGGSLLPFPLRLGLAPTEDLSDIPEKFRRVMHRREFGTKILVDLAWFQHALSGPVPAGLVVVGRRSGAAEPAIRRLWRPAALPALFSSLVVGWGVPQLTEFMLRRDLPGLAGLAGLALGRASAAAGLLARAPLVELTLGTDRRANAAALLGLL